MFKESIYKVCFYYICNVSVSDCLLTSQDNAGSLIVTCCSVEVCPEDVALLRWPLKIACAVNAALVKALVK